MKKLSYPLVASVLALFSVLLVSFSQHHRVFEENKNLFFIFRGFFILLMVGFSSHFYYRRLNDISGALFSISLFLYVVIMMWFMPLYETAYLQVAIGCAFLRFKRSWLHPLICFFAAVAILITYQIQDELLWKLPEETRQDWISIIVIFFGLAWAIQKFAISAHRKDSDNLRRFGAIGRDATRLTHDLKGLLSSPMLILESMQNKNLDLPEEFYEKQLSLLITDMEHVREAIKGINRLAILDEAIHRVDLNKVLSSVINLLERRLKRIAITMPESKIVMGNEGRLHSIFFNLLINSLQSFEDKKIEGNQEINIFWRKNCLIFKDNAGGIPRKNSEVNGLGLDLIKSDLQVMDADFKIYSEGAFTIAEIKFSKKFIE